MATAYEPMTAAGTASTSSRETPRAKKTPGVATSIPARRFAPERRRQRRGHVERDLECAPVGGRGQAAVLTGRGVC